MNQSKIWTYQKLAKYLIKHDGKLRMNIIKDIIYLNKNIKEIIMEKTKHKCLRCGYEWEGKKDTKQCPACKSYRWNVPRKEEKGGE